MVRKARSAFSISKDKPRRIVQALAVDEFGELASRKRAALTAARQHGHQMAGWHRRPNDAAGRWNTYCVDCNRAAVVCTETPANMPDAYGAALTEECMR